ncbi:MAG: NADH-quinone oxidoreductase subunit F, partial [Chloroflexi bacterium]
MVYRAHVLISGEPRCIAKGAKEVEEALLDKLHELHLEDEVQVVEVGSLGHGEQGPEMVIYPEGTHYVYLTPADTTLIVEEHLLKGRPVRKLIYKEPPSEPLPPPSPKEIRVVLKNVGKIDPENIEDYIAFEGYEALAHVLSEMTPEEVIAELQVSGLRGRGGAGFPTWLKWSFARKAAGDKKYLVCNGDEGDPGAFMNRRVLEGDPHAVIEGMVIAAYAIGAQQGYFYVRAEYPIAIHTLRVAIQQARDYGLLGK